MPIESFFFVHNPTAGRGAAATAWKRIRPVLDAAGVRYGIVTTEAPRHAEAIAERAAGDGWDAVVAVGGDGTVQQVAAGLMRAADGGPTIPMGIVGVGSGNDFIKLLDLPQQQPEAAARRLLEGRIRRVDIGRVGERYFTNGVGVGFDAQVAIRASRIRHLRGMPLYGWALLKVLRSLQTPRIRLLLDGVEVMNERLTVVTIGNGACHGGGFWICPGARPDDGLFDICVAEALTPLQLLRVIPAVMRGTHVTRPDVQILQARHVHISSPDPLPVHADGEVLAEAVHELELELLPGRLTVLA
ncbi:MAG: diacylglycerol kinase family lipid kinase [Gemmatimonadetes bacterium]|nr:diacylglycerol kinase family lipid kinase [Gemmatimonadota bacterium]